MYIKQIKFEDKKTQAEAKAKKKKDIDIQTTEAYHQQVEAMKKRADELLDKMLSDEGYTEKERKALKAVFVFSWLTAANGFKPNTNDFPGKDAKEIYDSHDGNGLPKDYLAPFRHLYKTSPFFWELPKEKQDAINKSHK